MAGYFDGETPGAGQRLGAICAGFACTPGTLAGNAYYAYPRTVGCALH
ncbi:MAG: hypothetical protein LBT59_09450 [Clostridiales bacterium]|nr:hypothetical protein [Clostridiales bacterium]